LFPIAHIASAMLFNRLLYQDKGLVAGALGSLIPDAVDKPLAWVLRVTPSSHYLAHTPLAAAGLSLIVARLSGARAARSFGSAYLLHLLTDDLHHGRVAWLLPFSRYRRLPRRRSIWLFAIGLLGEVPAFALARFLLRRSSAAGADDAALTVGDEGQHMRLKREDDVNDQERDRQRSADGAGDRSRLPLAEAVPARRQERPCW
jgi:hypothetical protein